ncbi:uncharacterized protein PRCAT00005065001 [Priceomyces carsonii]|uniref:uncharacterized protein n=1 Tax=Priceomyces carsonii TaxID=28549 RepID=UPI002EDA37DA|nr:unnamed protein product [Priceomyces carsonii]
MDTEEFWNNNRTLHYQETLEPYYFASCISLGIMVDIGDAKDIIEVGSGTGIYTVHLLSNLKKTRSIISVDVSLSMIELAEERKKNLNGINKKIDHKFCLGDAQDLAFVNDECADVYVSTMCIHIMSDPSKFLAEAWRVLKSNGRIGLTVPVGVDDIMDLFLRNFKKVGYHPRFPKDVFELGNRDKMINLLQSNGFEVLYCWSYSVKLPYSRDSDIEYLFEKGDISPMFSSLNEKQKEESKANIVAEFNEMKRKFIPQLITLLSVVAIKKP